MIITGNESLSDVIKQIDDFLLSQNEMLSFESSKSTNAVRKQEMAMHGLVSSLENNGVHNVRDMTVFEVYQRIEYYDELIKKMKKSKP